MRDQLWPAHEAHLWDRKANKGFATIPKTLPLILRIMDEITKGAPVSTTYLALWCATWDNSYVVIGNPTDLAFASGFGGQRAVTTWTARMKKLEELGFIKIKAGKSGPISHVLIRNPHHALRQLKEKKEPGLTEHSYTVLIERALEIGAKDMLDDPMPEETPAAPAPTAPPAPAPAPTA